MEIGYINRGNDKIVPYLRRRLITKPLTFIKLPISTSKCNHSLPITMLYALHFGFLTASLVNITTYCEN
jgi:hypothetical protein